MGYTKGQFERAVRKLGEVFFVLESGKEYIIHGAEGYEIDSGIVKAEGMNGDEYLKVSFPLEAIEHHYTHREI